MPSITTTFQTFANVARSGSNANYSWQTPSNAQTSNDVRSKYVYNTTPLPLSGDETSNYLECTNITTKVPSGATIDGFVVSIERRSATPTDEFYSSTTTDSLIRLVSFGLMKGDNKSTGATWGYTDTTVTYGGSTDKWNVPVDLTDADVNDSSLA